MEDFLNEIDKVISGEFTSTKSNMLISPINVANYLEDIGFVKEDFDSNGWDWDFWATYVRGEERFQLTSNGCYKKGLIFSRI